MIAALPPGHDELLGSAVLRTCATYRLTPEDLWRHVTSHPKGEKGILTNQWFTEFSQLFGMRRADLIKNHTLYPVSTAFVDAKRASHLVSPSNNHYRHFGTQRLLASANSRGLYRLFCNQCVLNEMARTGVSWWHRAHHVALFPVCPFHNCFLQMSDALLLGTDLRMPNQCHGREIIFGTPPHILRVMGTLITALLYSAKYDYLRRSRASIPSQLERQGVLSSWGVLNKRTFSLLRSQLPAQFWDESNGFSEPTVDTPWVLRHERQLAPKVLLLESARLILRGHW